MHTADKKVGTTQKTVAIANKLSYNRQASGDNAYDSVAARALSQQMMQRKLNKKLSGEMSELA